MNFTEFEKIFFDAEKAYEEKFGEPPSFQGWNRHTSENLQAMDKAIRTNTPLIYKDLSEGGKKIIFT
jgi:hypothetical protein